jgi:hypothetical protein
MPRSPTSAAGASLKRRFKSGQRTRTKPWGEHGYKVRLSIPGSFV